MKKLLLILLLVLTLCACGVQEETEIPEENPGESCTLPEDEKQIEPVPETVPIQKEEEEEEGIEIPSEEFSFEKPEILYPDFLTEELESSPAFKSALEKPSVIVYSEEPITNPDAAINFVEAFKKGEYAEFYYYSFSYADFDDTYRLYYNHFTTKDKLVYSEANYVFKWEDNFSETEKTVHNFVEINEYGCFELGWEWGDSTYYKVISDFAIYENEAKHRELKEKYIDPIFTITASPQEFTSASDLSSDFVWLFEDIYNYENGHDPWQEYGDYWPVSDMLELLNRYFDGVTKELLVSENKHYDSETDTIYYPGGRGGVPPKIRVVNYSQVGNLLTLNYVLYHSESGWVDESREIVLEIRLLDDGSFRYISQKIIEKE